MLDLICDYSITAECLSFVSELLKIIFLKDFLFPLIYIGIKFLSWLLYTIN